MEVFDDGTGPKVYMGASVTSPSGSANGLAVWDGTTLTEFADQPDNGFLTLDVLDLGGGPALYMAGNFTQVGATVAPGIARWDGTSWTAVGPGGVRGPLEAFDDGGGIKLYGLAEGTPDTTLNVMRLDGGTWTNIGVLTNPGFGTKVNDMQSYDDGSGPALYLAGHLATAGGTSAQNVARWNGASWSAVGNGLKIALAASFSGVWSLCPFDDGNGSRLYAGGRILGSGAVPAPGVMRWNGASWDPVGSGLGTLVPTLGGTAANVEFVKALAPYDDGNGMKLCAIGSFENAGSVSAYGGAVWDGSNWSGLGSGGNGVGDTIFAFAYGDDGSGPALYAGGRFTGAGSVGTGHVARWNGASWEALAAGVTNTVETIELYDDGSGADLFVGGSFNYAGNVPAAGVARWNGGAWSAVGVGMLPTVHVLESLNVGVGQRLYAGVSFGGPHIYSWNRVAWAGVGTGVDGEVRAIAAYLGDLYVGGSFLHAGGIPAVGLARWNASTGWSAVGTGGPGVAVTSLVVVNEPTGAVLHANGYQRWNGTSWSSIPPPTDPPFPAFNSVTGFAAMDVGPQLSSLIAYGSFDSKPIVRWTGTTWVPVSTETVDRLVYAVASVPESDGCAPALYLGGDFTQVDGAVAAHVTKLEYCTDVGTPYCFGDGSLGVPCPCTPPNTVPSPSGAAGHGCANSFNLDGAKMCAIGTASPDTVVLRVSGLTPAGFTQFFKGNAEIPGGFAFADGVRCVGGTFIRFGSQNAQNGTAFYPNASLGFTTPLSSIGGTPAGSGLTGHYQTIYRNVTANFCSAGLLNFSNAVKITWN